MPERIVGRLAMSGETGQVVLVEPLGEDEEDEDNIDYRIRVLDDAPPQGWSIAWAFIGFAFIIGVTIGGIIW